jgi:predicted metalloprotease
MLWKGRRESGNVDDRRGMAGPVAIGGGLLGVIALVINLLMGGDPGQIINQQRTQSGPASGQEQAVDEERASFVKTVLAETEDVWNEYFQKSGQDYQEPKLVLFRGATESGCGSAQSAMGPHYCPADGVVYIDLGFYDQLASEYGATGEGAMAYVIAHEVGHHIQNLMGITDKMNQMRQRMSEEEFNQYSVRLELQADFLAGVWAKYDQQRGVWQNVDVQSAMSAAEAVGDDKIQERTRGHVVPESFTHGTAEQRMRWFMKGYETGDINQGDTFNAARL